ALNPDGTSLRRRNGVGVSADGRQVHFVISEVPVNFHSFARLFRDGLGTPNALYLDGAVSKVYVPSLERNETGLDMGPIVGVVRE
ncbi:MAG: phosphodiester glycosidase family protein, partial [Hyphomonas sp.]